MKLNPDGVKARKEHARKTRQRVEVRREGSGNASIAGRELDTTDALASKAYIDALAVRIRNSGLIDATLPAIRARVMTELLQGRNPLDLIKPRPRHHRRPTPPAARSAPSDRRRRGRRRRRHASRDGARARRQPEAETATRASPTRTTPVPTTPATSTTPTASTTPTDFDDPAAPVPGYAGPDGAPAWTADEAENARYGTTNPTTPPAPRPAAPRPDSAAARQPQPHHPHRHPPRLGHRPRPGRRPRPPRPRGDPRPRRRRVQPPQNPLVRHPHRPGRPGDRPRPRPRPAPLEPTAATPREPPRNPTAQRRPARPAPTPHPRPQHHLRPHRPARLRPPHAEDRYTPSRKLKDLLRARTVTCDAPGCGAQAVHCDLDHTLPYPDGPTCQCNLSPKCRRHHRAKQAPGWRVEQPEPGIIRWTLPNGRTHTTTPTTYDS